MINKNKEFPILLKILKITFGKYTFENTQQEYLAASAAGGLSDWWPPSVQPDTAHK